MFSKLDEEVNLLNGENRAKGVPAPATPPASRNLAAKELSTQLWCSSSTSSSPSMGLQKSAGTKHPLPARPDWAAGLKAHQGLHPPRSRHDHHFRNISPRIPNQSSVQNQHTSQQLAPIFLPPTDFPPLSNVSSPTERKLPAAGAWNNSNLTARALHGNAQGTALFNHQKFTLDRFSIHFPQNCGFSPDD